MYIEEGIGVSEFIELLNQTYELAYPYVNIVGELANFRVSKNQWVYFDLKDELSTLKFFGTVYQLKEPLEDGMMLKVSCNPKMHNLYGFSMQIQAIELVGEGSLKRAAELLQIKLTKEGIFDMDKKRTLPYPPDKVGLITSSQSAAYHDFVKIINNRWRGVEVNLIDVQVQGVVAESQIMHALNHFNIDPTGIEVIVIIRGGGSAEDLATFNSEALTRAVSSSSIPTLVAVGHEIDISLAELAADRRASTPSHAAELLVPDKRNVLSNLKAQRAFIDQRVQETLKQASEYAKTNLELLNNSAANRFSEFSFKLQHQKELLEAYNPKLVLERGYSIIRKNSKIVSSVDQLSLGDQLDIHLSRGEVSAEVKSIR